VKERREGGVSGEKRERSDKDGKKRSKRKHQSAAGAEGGEARRRSGGGSRHGRSQGGVGGEKRSRGQSDCPSPEHSPAKKGNDRTILQFFGKRGGAGADVGGGCSGGGSGGGGGGGTALFQSEVQNGMPASHLSVLGGEGGVEGSGDVIDERQRQKWRELEMELKKREKAVEERTRGLLEREAALTKRTGNVTFLEEEARERAGMIAKQDIAAAADLRRGHDHKVSLAASPSFSLLCVRVYVAARVFLLCSVCCLLSAVCCVVCVVCCLLSAVCCVVCVVCVVCCVWCVSQRACVRTCAQHVMN